MYHHAFFFTRGGQWCVVQQGMNGATRTARRYHWLSESLTSFVSEPHAAICSDNRGTTLNLVAQEHARVRDSSVELATAPPDRVLDVVRRHGGRPKMKPGLVSGRLPFDELVTKTGPISPDTASELKPGFISGAPTLDMPAQHTLRLQDLDPRHLESVLLSTYERGPRTFEALLGLEGVGPRTLRALALVSEVIYGTPVSTRDPARFAFAHGGKDGTPFPVDRAAYDRTIDVLHRATTSAKVDRSEKLDALKRLGRFARVTEPTP